jgi:hypothetical protein
MSEDLTPEEKDRVREAMGFAPEGPREKPPGDRAREAHGEARAALRNAEAAARRKDHASAKMWTDTAKRMADVAAQLADTPLPQPSWEEEEAMRAELMGRISKLAGDEEARRCWQVRQEIWEELAAEARRTGAPMPPRPHHWMDDLPEGLRQRLENE